MAAITSQNIMQEIQNPNNWKRTRKKQYEVYVCRPALGTTETNRLEAVTYTTDANKQFIISGTVGEKRVIDLGNLVKTYCTLDGKPITAGYLQEKMGADGTIDWLHLKTIPAADTVTNWAFHLPLGIKNFPVQTSWGDTLMANRTGIGHGKGDFLVCADLNGMPNLNNMWVVNGEVFPTTYDMRAFPGLIDADTKLKVAETPVPKSIRGAKTLNNKRTMYQIVGRYMDGKEAVAYQLQSIDSDKSAQFTREQVCYLVGRDQVTNCEGQLYNGKVLLRGKGVNFDNLPTKQIDGEFKNTESLGRIRKDATAEQVMNQFMLIGTMKQGNNTIGYIVKNAGNATKRLSRAKILELAEQGRIGNARVQRYNGQLLLRGVNCNIDELPSEQVTIK